MSSECFSCVSRHARETVKRVRAYLRGRRGVELESLAVDAETLTINDWLAALSERRNNGRLIYREPSSLERCADEGANPFDTVVGRELIARLEAHLSPEQIPFLDAFIAGEKPREIAQRLGITAKAASARMRRFKAKLAELYTDSRPD
jgi:DNA-directed RNA polymerase specialized sigma24 family protein